MNKTIYEVPLYAYLHYDNTWSYSDYYTIESLDELKVIQRKQHSIERDEKGDPIIQYLLIYES